MKEEVISDQSREVISDQSLAPTLAERVARAMWEADEAPCSWEALGEAGRVEWTRYGELALGAVVELVLLPEYRYWSEQEEIAAAGALANVIGSFRLDRAPLTTQPRGGWREAVREALERAGHNVELHIEREVYEAGTARAVVQEFSEQFLPLLGRGTGETEKTEGAEI